MIGYYSSRIGNTRYFYHHFTDEEKDCYRGVFKTNLNSLTRSALYCKEKQIQKRGYMPIERVVIILKRKECEVC